MKFLLLLLSLTIKFVIIVLHISVSLVYFVLCSFLHRSPFTFVQQNTLLSYHSIFQGLEMDFFISPCIRECF